jgi:hypothetical protein
MTSVFALPASSSSQPTSSSTQTPGRAVKRKRTRQDSESDNEKLQDDESSYLDEYTAVLSPNERAQRRLAGFSLLNDLPLAPFPHRASRDTQHGPKTVDQPTTDPATSLRLQHLSVISAVLHKSLLSKDYPRARRALGLILRSEVGGRPIDIRAAANWAVGAEILFRDHEIAQEPTTRSEKQLQLNAGFVKAKSLYEMLIVQFPHNRTWPNVVNAVDFYLAMFSLWIYVAQAEAQDCADEDDLPAIKQRELDEATEILTRLDRCMLSAPFSTNEHLLRLRSMASEWHTLLVEDVQDLVSPHGGSPNPGDVRGPHPEFINPIHPLPLDDDSHLPSD